MNPRGASLHITPSVIGYLLVIVLLAMAAHAAYHAGQHMTGTRMNKAIGDHTEATNTVAPEPAEASSVPIDWSIMKSAPGRRARSGLSERFRLLGMYIAFGASTNSDRRAVIEDKKHGKELIVQKGDSMGRVLILEIAEDHVQLRGPFGDETLWLTFAGRPASADSTERSGLGELSQSRESSFGGRRLGQRRWEFQRKPLMDYYTELMNHPERLVKVFDSMKPVYEQDGRISGYQLDIEGEADFFAAVGLREGDIVRRVNDLDMSNRRRAEYFIKQFVNDSITAFMLDVERDGEVRRQLYQVSN